MRFGNTMRAEVKNRRREHRACMSLGHAFDEMLQRANPAAGNDRHGNSVGNRPCQREVVSGLSAVTVHRGDQQFPRAEFCQTHRVLDGIHTSRAAPSMREDFPALPNAPRID